MKNCDYCDLSEICIISITLSKNTVYVQSEIDLVCKHFTSEDENES